MGCVVQGRRCRRRQREVRRSKTTLMMVCFGYKRRDSRGTRERKERAGHQVGFARLARPPAVTAVVTKFPSRSTARSRTHRC